MSSPTKVSFPGADGSMLAARLDRPAGPVRAYALFAHCFTCSKDIFAASRIAAALAMRGFAVLRFDFTGLGASEGEFANTNFSSNVQDLLAATDFMRANYRAPDVLIGHSLGGAAVLAAAGDIPEVRAVATIGAPADAAHVTHNFHAHIDEIRQDGEAEVTLAGRQFKIKRQFLDDVEHTRLETRINTLKKALFVLHSPRDATVGIENAASIFTAAKHPKSFISLDDADHLLSRREDAVYVAEVLAAATARYIPDASPKHEVSGVTDDVAVVTETRQGKYQNMAQIGRHTLLADEPSSVGGLDSGPTPYDFLKIGLGACTTMTMRMYADRKGIDVDRFATRVSHDKVHADDCEECIERGLEGKVDTFVREIVIDGDVDDQTRAKLLEIAGKCPVHRTLESQAIVETRLATEE